MLKINTVTMEDKIKDILEWHGVDHSLLDNCTKELLNLFSVSCCFSLMFNNVEEAKALRTQLNMSNARTYILDQTEEFENKLDEFISNNS